MPRGTENQRADVQQFQCRQGARIARLRYGRKMTQAELAHQAGLSADQLAKYETGENAIKTHQLLAIAAALEVSPLQLMPAGARPATMTSDRELAEDIFETITQI